MSDIENMNSQNCAEKARLLAEYEGASKCYADAVAELYRKMPTEPKTEYERLQRAADTARVKSEQARLALEHHVAAHRC